MKNINLILTFSGITLLLLHLINYYSNFMGDKISYNFALGSLFCFLGILQNLLKIKK